MQIHLSDLSSQIYPFMNLWGFNPIWPGLSRRKDSQNLMSWIKESNFSRCWLGRGCSLRCPFCSNFFVQLWVTKLRSKLLYRKHRKATFFVRRRHPSRELHLVYSHSGAHKSVDSPIHYYFVLVKHSFMWTAILLSVMPSTVDKPGLNKKMTLNSESALKVYLSARRGSAVPAAMTEDDLTQDEKVRNSFRLLLSSK